MAPVRFHGREAHSDPTLDPTGPRVWLAGMLLHRQSVSEWFDAPSPGIVHGELGWLRGGMGRHRSGLANCPRAHTASGSRVFIVGRSAKGSRFRSRGHRPVRARPDPRLAVPASSESDWPKRVAALTHSHNRRDLFWVGFRPDRKVSGYSKKKMRSREVRETDRSASPIARTVVTVLVRAPDELDSGQPGALERPWTWRESRSWSAMPGTP